MASWNLRFPNWKLSKFECKKLCLNSIHKVFLAQADRKLLMALGPGPKVVLEPVPGRAFLLKSERSVSRPEIPKTPKSRQRSEKRLGEMAGGGGKSRYEVRLGMEVYHSKSHGPSYNSFCAMATSICLPRAPERRSSWALPFENWRQLWMRGSYEVPPNLPWTLPTVQLGKMELGT
jgi:hypothetical protein